MDPREPTPDDADRIRELVRSSMTTSYRLSPEQIESVLEDQFSDDRLTALAEDADGVALVADDGAELEERVVAGVVVGEVVDGVGEIRWLEVDPEHRGAGLGTSLLESAVEAFRERDVDHVRATTLEKSTEGEQFLERFGYVRTEERTIELGDETLVEYVHTEPSAADDDDATDSAKTDAGEVDFPDTEISDGVRTAATDDGQRVYLDTDDESSGTEDSFFATYTDEEFTDRYGYYCANCGSLNVMADDMDRLECGQCGNSHATRSGATYDDSYL